MGCNPAYPEKSRWIIRSSPALSMTDGAGSYCLEQGEILIVVHIKFWARLRTRHYIQHSGLGGTQGSQDDSKEKSPLSRTLTYGVS